MTQAIYETVELPIDDVKPSTHNPRKTFDKEQLDILRDSIKQHAILEPILVRKEGLEIIDGERRWRSLRGNGAATIVARIYDVDEPTAAEIRLTAQMQRVDLSDREKEDALYELWIEGSETGRYETQRDMAKATGINIQTLKRFISAKGERAALQDEGIENVSAIDLSETHILKESDPDARNELLMQRQEGNITWDEMRELKNIIAEKDHGDKSAKEIIDEFKTIKQEQKAETRDALKRRKLQGQGVEDIVVTKGVQEFEEFTSESRLLKDYQDTYSRVWSSFRVDVLKNMKDESKQKACVNLVWKVYKASEEVLNEMGVL
jgi:ParB/RepB/Spo0J family partition protein